MASVLCEIHSKHDGKYIASVKLPYSYPNKGIICYRHGCYNPGKVWLASEEEADYRNGERVFTVGYFIKVQVQ
jgi:hypothetical protein